MKITRWAAVAALGVAAGAVALAGPATAAETATFAGSVTNAPDNHCPTWARDTFTRTTAVTETGTGQYDIRQEISGTWVSTDDAAIKGTIAGFVEYTVSGTLLADPEGADDDVDLSSLDCKANAPADSKTGNWALRYFEPGATAGGITAWEYTYDTACEDQFVESDSSEAMGAGVFTLVCQEDPDPDPTKPADPPADDPECVDVNTADTDELKMLMHIDDVRAAQILDLRPFSSVADLDRVDGLLAGGPRLAELVKGGDGFLPLCDIAAPGGGGGGGGDDDKGLPVTGAPALLIGAGGAALLTLGGGAYLLARKRRVSFTS